MMSTVYSSSACNKLDPYAPCGCKVINTNTVIYQDGRTVTLEFPEQVCQDSHNRKRVTKGRIPSGFRCVQLRADRMLYRDAAGEVIQIPVIYRAGCELRCLGRNCKIADGR